MPTWNASRARPDSVATRTDESCHQFLEVVQAIYDDINAEYGTDYEVPEN